MDICNELQNLGGIMPGRIRIGRGPHHDLNNAADWFDRAATEAQKDLANEPLRLLAIGLAEMARALDSDIMRLEFEVDQLKDKVEASRS